MVDDENRNAITKISIDTLFVCLQTLECYKEKTLLFLTSTKIIIIIPGSVQREIYMYIYKVYNFFLHIKLMYKSHIITYYKRQVMY